MRTIVYGSHTIQVETGWKERVLYDGQVMGNKHTWRGSTHIFSVKEDGENVQYEVEYHARDLLATSTWVVIRRNGKIIFSDK